MHLMFFEIALPNLTNLTKKSYYLYRVPHNMLNVF